MTDTATVAMVSAELQHAVQQTLFHEARLLDERRFDEWLDLFTDDVRYWMPARYNRSYREVGLENGRRGEIAHFDEDKASLRRRVVRLSTNQAWSEDPPSRTRHLVTNVLVEPRDGTDELDVRSAFLTYRNRSEHDVDIWVGERRDVLRPGGRYGHRIADRTIILDQATLLSNNLSVFL